MKKKRILLFLLQLSVIAGTLFFIINYTNQQIEPINVFVYERNFNDISREIRQSDIKQVTIPKNAVTSSFALKAEDIIGKHVDGNVSKGQYVFKDQLVEFEDIDVFELIDLSQYRKVSLPISYVEAFSGNIKKGDSLDLVYVGSGIKETENEDGRIDATEFIYSKTFLQDVLVWSVNTKDGFVHNDVSQISLSATTSGGEEITTSAKSSDEIAVITLAVKLEDAEEINTRLEAGAIRFVGRFDSSENYNTLGYVIGDYEKIFTGEALAETDALIIEDDSFE